MQIFVFLLELVENVHLISSVLDQYCFLTIHLSNDTYVCYIYTGFSLLGGNRGVPTISQEFTYSPLSIKLSFPPYQKSIQPNKKNKNVIFCCSHCSCTIFVLISYSFETQIMLLLILIDGRYSQNAVFSFEEFLNCQNHFSSGSHHLVKNRPSSVHYFLTQSQRNS